MMLDGRLIVSNELQIKPRGGAPKSRRGEGHAVIDFEAYRRGEKTLPEIAAGLTAADLGRPTDEMCALQLQLISGYPQIRRRGGPARRAEGTGRDQLLTGHPTRPDVAWQSSSAPPSARQRR